MTTRTDYQFFARECLRWAQETNNEQHRQAFLEMAKVWTQLAMRRPHGELVASSATANDAPYRRSDNPEIG
jgi:ferric-dicitrate binding protein FerR (iron transport regulator)